MAEGVAKPRAVLEVGGPCGDGGLPIRVEIINDAVFITGATVIIAEVPFTTKYGNPMFTTDHVSESKDAIVVALRTPTTDELEVLVGRRGEKTLKDVIASRDLNSLHHPHILVRTEGEGDGRQLVIEAQQPGSLLGKRKQLVLQSINLPPAAKPSK